MTIHYLDHSGVAVETDHHFLVFDYFTDTPTGGTLAEGVFAPALLPVGKQLLVFVSHGHHDHYNKVVHSWKAQLPNALLFFGNDIPPCPDAITIAPGQTITPQDVAVTALRSTDQGVAFLVEVDGVAIYHAGDLNWWHWDGEDEGWLRDVATAYCREIDSLAHKAIDLACVPVDPRLQRTAFWAAQYFMKTVKTAQLLPIHLWDDYGISGKLMADPDSAAFAQKVLAVTHRGQAFVD